MKETNIAAGHEDAESMVSIKKSLMQETMRVTGRDWQGCLSEISSTTLVSSIGNKLTSLLPIFVICFCVRNDKQWSVRLLDQTCLAPSLSAIDCYKSLNTRFQIVLSAWYSVSVPPAAGCSISPRHLCLPWVQQLSHLRYLICVPNWPKKGMCLAARMMVCQ